jgi:hypothetical protein
MDDPSIVRSLKGLTDLFRDGERLANRNRAACDPIGKRFAFDQFQDEIFRPYLARTPPAGS